MSSGSWARMLKHGVRWAVIVPAIGSLIGAWRSALAEYAHLDLLGQLALLGLGIIQVVVAGFVLLAVRGRVFEWTVVLITSALLVAFVLGRPASAGPVNWWPNSAVVLVQCWVLAFGSRHRWRIGTVGVILFAGIRLWSVLRTGAPWAVSVGDVVVATQLPLSVVLGLAAVHRVASRNDRAERERAQALADEAARGADAARAREVGRFLHDDLSHVLRAISGVRRLEHSAVRKLASGSVGRLESGILTPRQSPEPDLLDRLSGLAEVTGVRVRVSGRAPVLPPDVVEVITAAATEALRNVRRHAGTDEARIRVRSSRAGVVVSVVDHGCGLPPEARWGVGIAQSMVGRMAEVGGAATVRPGRRGTVVELSWSPDAVTERLADTWRELTRAMTPMVVPGLVGTVIIGLVVLDDLANPALALLSLVIFAACGAFAVLRGTRLAPVRFYVLLVVTAVACFAANVFALSPQTVNGYHLFMAGGAACILMLVAIQHSFVWSLLAVVIVWGAMFGLGTLRFGLDTLTLNLFGALTAPFVVLGVLLPRAVLNRIVCRTLGAREQTLRSRVRAQRLAERHGSEDARLQRTRRRVVPFLRAVAEGDVALDDPAVVREAIRLEASVRDELRFGGTEDALAEAIDRVRRTGWSVEIRVRPEDRDRVVEQAAVLLAALGDKDEGTGTAFLSAFGDVVVVVRNPSPDKLREWRARTDIEVEEGDQWCRLISRSRIPSGVGSRWQSKEPVTAMASMGPA